MNTFLSSKFLLVCSLRCPVCKIMSSVNSFIYFFPIWIYLIYYSCLIALTRISSTIINKNGKNGHPHLFPYFTTKNDVSCMLFKNALYQVSEVSFYLFQVCWTFFIIKKCWILSNSSSEFNEVIMWRFFIIPLICCIILIGFQMLNWFCVSGISHIWSWYNFFYTLLDSVY